ncbi:pantoate--beta-alanine ligase [Heliophilum fasciatum]|uniref:Pantothenate synthetase n=1 Tax=Heliophilum fasciatum TaxID=35700 RepID=A0A4R2RXW8_9FIRM|nr:pantoate--beta-alanine ligase [Heliophilum fasciatum]MCW2277071.1 pantoate--beta-alanine ligase [Heliophilum fasciatum]TCP68403.1 pantothenate synthetase [Heliophilum fasciatum]
MLLLTSIEDMVAWTRATRREGLSIGLVPTMGYLHEGHLTLMRTAKAACDRVVVSIFVNPMQFGVGEDFEEYPRDLSRDQALAASVGVDVIFAPTVRGMYPNGFASAVEVQGLTDGLCGAARPGHFRGVTTVVCKLLNIVAPDNAYFGQKDAQQVAVIRRMVLDLNMLLTVVTVPIVREADGLALSSRNVYLSPEDRQAALVLFRALTAAQAAVEAGERDATVLRRLMIELIAQEPRAEVDYVAIVDNLNLQPLEKLEGACLLALAVRFGKTRLIDNLVVEV